MEIEPSMCLSRNRPSYPARPLFLSTKKTSFDWKCMKEDIQKKMRDRWKKEEREIDKVPERVGWRFFCVQPKTSKLKMISLSLSNCEWTFIEKKWKIRFELILFNSIIKEFSNVIHNIWPLKTKLDAQLQSKQNTKMIFFANWRNKQNCISRRISPNVHF